VGIALDKEYVPCKHEIKKISYADKKDIEKEIKRRYERKPDNLQLHESKRFMPKTGANIKSSKLKPKSFN
jgi:hypothetical protein